jgi:hypothetical protein
VLVDNGNETGWWLAVHRQPHHVALSLQHAVSQILAPVGRVPQGRKDDSDATDVVSRA